MNSLHGLRLSIHRQWKSAAKLQRLNEGGTSAAAWFATDDQRRARDRTPGGPVLDQEGIVAPVPGFENEVRRARARYRASGSLILDNGDSYFRPRFSLRAVVAATFLLMLPACSQSSALPLLRGAPQYPQLNPMPKLTVRLRIMSSPTIAVSGTAVYVATRNSPECFQRVTMDAEWPLSVEEKFLIPKDAASDNIYDVKLDRYMPGHCEWRFRRFVFDYGRPPDEKPAGSEFVDAALLSKNQGSINFSLLCGNRIFNSVTNTWVTSKLYCSERLFFDRSAVKNFIDIKIVDNDLLSQNRFPIISSSGTAN